MLSRLLPIRRTLRLAAPALLLAGALAFGTPEARAQNLLYEPRNPAFGGNPLNYQWMLSSAQAQNRFEEQRAGFLRDPLADFESNLQRQILNQLAREIILSRFGDIDLGTPGQFDFGGFQLEVIPGVGGTTIRVFNTLTGEETVITIPGL